MLELSIYFEKSRYQDAIKLLKTMVQYWPDRAKYWDMLAAAYLELERDSNALDNMLIAYSKGLLVKESKILDLARLCLLEDIPFTAGDILTREMQEGRVEATKKNLDLLLSASINSREYRRATNTIDQLAPLAEDGRYYMQKAGIFSELGEWEEAAKAAQRALDLGVDKPSEANVLMGMAYSELGQLQQAMRVFSEVKRSEDARTRRNANAWLGYLQERLNARNARITLSN